MSVDIPKVFPDVVSMLRHAAQSAPDHEALVCGDVRLNYAQYLALVQEFALELAELGAAGQRVALLLSNSLDLCIAMFAAHMSGAQVVPLNPRYTSTELSDLLRQADVQVLIHDSTNNERDSALAEALNIPNRIEIGASARRLIAFDERKKQNPSQQQPDFLLTNELAMLQFTGGTTGVPKGVNVMHRAVALNIAQRESIVPTRVRAERILCVMPLYHCYAIHMCMHNMVNCQGTLVIVEPYEPSQVLQTITDEFITIFGGSPTLFNGLMASESFSETDFSSLEVTYSGSAALSQDLLQRWESATGSIAIEGYGQSESGPVISFNPINGPRKLGSVGIPVPQTEINILDNAGQSLAVGQSGEICIRGPQVMAGYRNSPDETAKVIRDGCLHTGDIGELDADGYLFIKGRLKEMLNVSGFNVYPNEVEDVLLTHPAVREAAVVGREDKHKGQLVVACVVADGRNIPLEDIDLERTELAIIEHCRQSLAAYKVPIEIKFIVEMPKTSVRKLDKHRITKMISE